MHPSTDPETHRRLLGDEIAQRQSAITRAEADIGRVVADRIRRSGARVGDPALVAELNRMAQSEAAIDQLGQQLRAIDDEAVAAAGGRAHRCDSCRSGVAPGQRFCTVCGASQAATGAQVAAHAAANGSPGCARCGHPIMAGAYCSSCGWRVGQTRLRFYRSRWFRILLAGLALYAFCQIALPHTSYAGALIIAELIIGASLIPIVYVSWLYERGSCDQVPFAVVVSTFVGGAVLGCAAAVILESAIHISGNAQYVPVGFIEEGCKILIVLLWLRRKDLHGADKGLVIGAATGMGFATLETMQYGLTAFIEVLREGGGVESIHVLSATLNVRGLLAPLGHGTWTGILAAVIWSSRESGRRPLGLRALMAYIAVSLLHAVYDVTIDSHVGAISFISGSKVSIFGLLLGLVGLATLLLMVRSIHRGHDPVTRFFDVLGRWRHSKRAPAGWPNQHFPPGYPPPVYGPPPGYGPPPHDGSPAVRR